MDTLKLASKAMRGDVRSVRDGGATPRRANAHLLPTLLDRLRDDAPQRQTEAPSEYAVTRAQMRDIVQRDRLPAQHDQHRGPDRSQATSARGFVDRKFRRAAAGGRVHGNAQVGRHREDHPRCDWRVRTRLISDSLSIAPLAGVDADVHYNVLAFEIRCMIRMDPYPLEFMVQSSLDLETSQLNVTGMRAG